MTRRRIALVSTGGTIEKTYDSMAGVLRNNVSVLDVMLESLDLRGVRLERVALMNKDSMDMSSGDHELIASSARNCAERSDGVVIVHGTDRLTITGELIARQPVDVPIVLTGAMRPYMLRNTDAMQNLTEALLAVQLIPAGVWVAMHNRVLQFPGVEKDPNAGTFVKRSDP